MGIAREERALHPSCTSQSSFRRLARSPRPASTRAGRLRALLAAAVRSHQSCTPQCEPHAPLARVTSESIDHAIATRDVGLRAPAVVVLRRQPALAIGRVAASPPQSARRSIASDRRQDATRAVHSPRALNAGTSSPIISSLIASIRPPGHNAYFRNASTAASFRAFGFSINEEGDR